MAGSPKYELAWIGDKVETDFKDIQISAKDLVACREKLEILYLPAMIGIIQLKLKLPI